MNEKIQKKNYHDIKKLFGKEYFKSYCFINPKVNLSLSPSPSHLQTSIKKKFITPSQNSLYNVSNKFNKNSQIIKISKNYSNKGNFNLRKAKCNKTFKKTKLLIDSIINKSNNNPNKINDFSAFNNYMSISHRQSGYYKKKIDEKYINNNISDCLFNNFRKNINPKRGDKNINYTKKVKNSILCDSLFKLNRENKIRMKNEKNKNKIMSKNNKNKNLLKLNGINTDENNKNNNIYHNENNKYYLKKMATKNFLKKIKFNNINNLKNININKNKSYEYSYKKRLPISESKNHLDIKKNNKNYIQLKKAKNTQFLYSQLFSHSQNLNSAMNNKKKNLYLNTKTNNTNISKNFSNNIRNINSYYYKNKSIDINNNKSFKYKLFLMLREERRKKREQLIKKNIEEIQKNSLLRKQRYIELFNIINKSFFDIKQLIEKIEKEDLLKDITLKINDDMSYDTMLNNENSISIEQTFKSILNNGLLLNGNKKNNSYNENTSSIIDNDFTFEEDKKDISLKSISIKNNLLESNNNFISNTRDRINENNNNCFIS